MTITVNNNFAVPNKPKYPLECTVMKQVQSDKSAYTVSLCDKWENYRKQTQHLDPISYASDMPLLHDMSTKTLSQNTVMVAYT